MRRSTVIVSTSAHALALGLAFAPLAASAAPEIGAPWAPTKLNPPPAIELHEDEADNAIACTPGQACATGPDLVQQRGYLLQTAHPGGTMTRQGPELAIARLHPDFVPRLAAAIREAREAGLAEAGIFSAYRPPAFGVGGFKDKFHSLHAYGLAVDMYGIGSPGSSGAKLWHRIAAKHGVACPYGASNPAEWNHCQPTRIKVVKSDNPLRKTISPQGPLNPANMFEAGRVLIESVANLFAAAASVSKADGTTVQALQQRLQIRTAVVDASRPQRPARLSVRRDHKRAAIRSAAIMDSARQQRPVKASKDHKPAVTRSAAVSGKTRARRHTVERHGANARRAQKANSS